MIKRRLLALLFLSPFSIVSVLAPINAYAFVPAAVGGYGLPTIPATGSYAAAGGVNPFTVGAGAFAVGMAIGYFGLEYLLGDGTQEHVRIPLTSDSAGVVPAPSAPVSAVGVPQSDAEACYAFWFNTYGSSLVYAPVQNGLCYPFDAGWYQLGYAVSITSVSHNSTCPPGYIASGTSCNLSDARAVTPDKNCDFSRSGTTLSGSSSLDPDCAAALLKMPFNCANGVCTGQGVSDTGNPQTWAITPRVDGGSTLQTVTQKTVNGQTQVQTSTVGISPAGTVDSVSGDVQAGSIPSSSTGSASTPVTTSSNLQQPEQQIQPITFPSDYARTGEAAAAAAPIKTGLDTLHNDLSATQNVSDPVIPVAADMPWFGTTFQNLTSWSVPGHVSTCPQPSFNLLGVDYVMNSHCQLVQDNFAPLRAAMVVAWLILATFVVLRA